MHPNAARVHIWYKISLVSYSIQMANLNFPMNKICTIFIISMIKKKLRRIYIRQINLQKGNFSHVNKFTENFQRVLSQRTLLKSQPIFCFAKVESIPSFLWQTFLRSKISTPSSKNNANNFTVNKCHWGVKSYIQESFHYIFQLYKFSYILESGMYLALHAPQL